LIPSDEAKRQVWEGQRENESSDIDYRQEVGGEPVLTGGGAGNSQISICIYPPHT
jgi:hypothetical protein